tara:strand:- start:338 stop:649 length:312 start_codon:yes stop_codon:yes gene_type:complete
MTYKHIYLHTYLPLYIILEFLAIAEDADRSNGVGVGNKSIGIGISISIEQQDININIEKEKLLLEQTKLKEELRGIISSIHDSVLCDNQDVRACVLVLIISYA